MAWGWIVEISKLNRKKKQWFKLQSIYSLFHEYNIIECVSDSYRIIIYRVCNSTPCFVLCTNLKAKKTKSKQCAAVEKHWNSSIYSFVSLNIFNQIASSFYLLLVSWYYISSSQFYIIPHIIYDCINVIFWTILLLFMWIIKK